MADSTASAARKPRTLRLGGRDYPVILPSIRDPRLHVAAVLLTLQVLGQTVLNFRLSIAQILICLAVGALIEFGVGFFKDHMIMWPASGLLTGNSTAFILRVPGTLHGQYWSLNGIEIFIAVVAVGMASKYLIRWRGRHIFNPSNVALVLAFVLLGPQRTEPLDLWWIPMGPWLIVTYAILIVGGLAIGYRLGLLGMQVAYTAGFAAFLGFALAPEPDHCMVASWHLAPMCGFELWRVITTSPELLIFALFMLPDPRTVPEGKWARILFGLAVALGSVLLLGPTSLEFWTKTAILASLVVACALRFPVAAFVARSREVLSGQTPALPRRDWRVASLAFLSILSLGFLPLSADLSTRSPQPASGLADGSLPTIPLRVDSGPTIAGWVDTAAGDSLPPPGQSVPVPKGQSTRVWHLPALPPVNVPGNVQNYNPKLTPDVAAHMEHEVVLDLVIEAEARRTHDPALAATGAILDGLTPFTDLIKADIAAGDIVATSYTFDRCSLTLFLPKFSGQAPQLLGVTVTGTRTLTSYDSSGNQLTQTRDAYVRSWGLGPPAEGGHQLIDQNYTGLTPAG